MLHFLDSINLLIIESSTFKSHECHKIILDKKSGRKQYLKDKIDNQKMDKNGELKFQENLYRSSPPIVSLIKLLRSAIASIALLSAQP
jgi:hypothetical protein